MKKLCILILLVATGFMSFAQTRHAVQIRDNRFEPSTLTVNVGDVVEWTNAGSMTHTSTSGSNCEGNGTWNSGNLNTGQSFSFTFTSAGAFSYFCILHCAEMNGSVTVQMATSSKEAEQEAFALYPNPATGFVKLSLNLKVPGEVTVKAIDFIGREMAAQVLKSSSEAGVQEYAIDIRNWPSGAYMLRVMVGEKYVVSQKLIRK